MEVKTNQLLKELIYSNRKIYRSFIFVDYSNESSIVLSIIERSFLN